MMKKGITMTTDMIVRYATDICKNNDITNFSSLFITEMNIEAVSWELLDLNRERGFVPLFTKMVETLEIYDDRSSIYLYIELSGVQPDTSITRYKQAWGLLKSRGNDTEFALKKQNVMVQSSRGLTLSGLCHFYLSDLKTAAKLVLTEKKTYLALIPDENIYERLDITQIRHISDWANFIWQHNGIVLMILGAFDDLGCEIVALGRNENIFSLTKGCCRQ